MKLRSIVRAKRKWNVSNAGILFQLAAKNQAHTGPDPTVIGSNITAIGPNITVIGPNMTVIGSNITLIGSNITLIGSNITVIGSNITVIGRNFTQNGPNSRNIGVRQARTSIFLYRKGMKCQWKYCCEEAAVHLFRPAERDSYAVPGPGQKGSGGSAAEDHRSSFRKSPALPLGKKKRRRIWHEDLMVCENCQPAAQQQYPYLSYVPPTASTKTAAQDAFGEIKTLTGVETLRPTPRSVFSFRRTRMSLSVCSPQDRL